MCFSSTASFVASGFLALVGAACCYVKTSKKEWLIALTPIGFAIQQFCEGLIWLSVSTPNFPHYLLNISKWTYILFAYMIWPIWIPLAILAIETSLKRKFYLYFFVFLGAIITTYNIIHFDYTLIFKNGSIRYTEEIENLYALVFYCLVLTVPLVISSNKLFRILAIFSWISFVITIIRYRMNFCSIWCFYAAVTSCLVLYILYKQRRKKYKINLKSLPNKKMYKS